MNRVARRGIGLAGGLTLALGAGAILGVALGRSAIAEINPIHYRDPPPLRVAGDDTGPAQDSFGQAYDWNQGAVARAVDCGGDCDRREARDAASFTFDAPPAPHDDAVFAEPPPWPPGAVDDGRGPAEQYAHYPIEAKPADAEPAAPAAPLAVPKDDAAAGQ